jgi:urease accessory protein
VTDLASPASQLEPARHEWLARLRLDYARVARRTALVRREHLGPLRVQRPFYPEGPEVCHTYLVHPPAGMASGDRIEAELNLHAGAHALITTPGAAKWYRSPGEWAAQDVRLTVGPDAVLEWLPQEAILFRGARAATRLRVELASGALFLGWEITCFGRTASGERFSDGELRQRIDVSMAGAALWHEQTQLEGGGRLFDSPAGLRGCSVTGLLLAAGRDARTHLLEACRAIPCGDDAQCGVTTTPGVLAARYLGRSAEDARHYFRALWGILRPELVHRPACAPRIWNT